MFPGHYVFHCQGTEWGAKLVQTVRQIGEAVRGESWQAQSANQIVQLQAILAHPDDEEPRLAYANELTQLNDPRGRFIHLQCELDRMTPEQRKWSAEKALEKAIFAKHGAEWSAKFHDLGVNWCGFRRGLVEKVVLLAWEFLYRGERLLQLAPIQSVYLSGDGFTVKDAEELAECAFLEKLRYLEIHDVHQDTVDRFMVSPYLANLRGLDLCANYIYDLPTDNKSWIGNLEYMCLDQNCFYDDTLVEFFEDVGPRKLRILKLASNHFTDEAIQMIAAHPREHLESLDLSDNAITDSGLKLLAASPNFPKLQLLGLASTQITDAGLQALAESPNFSALQSLNVDNIELSMKSVMALHQSTSLKNLRHLQINVARIVGGLKCLTEPENQTAITRFELNSISPDQRMQETVDQIRRAAPDLVPRFKGASDQEILALQLASWWDSLPDFYAAFLRKMGNDSAGLIDCGNTKTDVHSLITWYERSRDDFQRFNPPTGFLPISLPSADGTQICLKVTETELPVYALSGPRQIRLADSLAKFISQGTKNLPVL